MDEGGSFDDVIFLQIFHCLSLTRSFLGVEIDIFRSNLSFKN